MCFAPFIQVLCRIKFQTHTVIVGFLVGLPFCVPQPTNYWGFPHFPDELLALKSSVWGGTQKESTNSPHRHIHRASNQLACFTLKYDRTDRDHWILEKSLQDEQRKPKQQMGEIQSKCCGSWCPPGRLPPGTRALCGPQPLLSLVCMTDRIWQNR